MPFESIWSILGLSAPTKDITEIKRAYAAKAKMTNPEDDPEGFERLHGAYKSALSYARSAGRVSTPVIKTPAKSPSKEPKKGDFDFSSVDTSSKPNAEPKTEDKKNESFDYSSVNIDKPVKKEINTRVIRKTDDYDFSSVNTNRELKTEKKKTADFDYSSVNVPTPGITDTIRFFREENKICTDAQVNKLDIRAKRSVAERLTSLYISTAYSYNNTDLWKDYWEEPVIRYYRLDPAFRKWVVELVKSKRHNEVIKQQADSYKKYLPRHRWNANPKYAPGSKLTFFQEKAIVGFFILLFAVLFGFYYHKDDYQIDHLWESLALGAAAMIILWAYDAFDKAATNARKKKNNTQKK